jgi:hypothetical protein
VQPPPGLSSAQAQGETERRLPPASRHIRNEKMQFPS